MMMIESGYISLLCNRLGICSESTKMDEYLPCWL